MNGTEFTVAEAARTFFDRSPDWLRRTQNDVAFVGLGTRRAVPHRSDAGNRAYSIEDIRAIADRLRDAGRLNPENHSAVLRRIEAVEPLLRAIREAERVRSEAVEEIARTGVAVAQPWLFNSWADARRLTKYREDFPDDANVGTSPSVDSALDPQLVDDAWEADPWIDGFTPRIMPRTLWDSSLGLSIRPVLRTVHLSGRQSAEQVAWTLCNLCLWALDVGLPLDWEVILDPANVEAFVQASHQRFGSTPTPHLFRAVLRRIGPQLTSRAPWEARPSSLPRHQSQPPYSADELAAVESDIWNQSTELKQLAARAFVDVGAGAGLDGRWATRLRGTDVIRVPEAVLIRTGPPHPRLVPVLARYETDLIELAETAGDGLLIGPRSTHRNIATKICAHLDRGHDSPPVSLRRLRATWLVHHLRAGTRLPELMSAAGITSPAALLPLLRFVPPLDENERLSVLRGAP